MGRTDRYWPCWKKFWFATYFRMGLVGWWLWVWIYGGHGCHFWWCGTSTWTCSYDGSCILSWARRWASSKCGSGFLSKPSRGRPQKFLRQDLNLIRESPKYPKMFQKFLWQTLSSWVFYVVGVCWRLQASLRKKLGTFCPPPKTS